MSLQLAEGWTRRRFLGGLTVAGAAGLLRLLAVLLAKPAPAEERRGCAPWCNG
jgi:hypothetical protein